MSNYELVRNSHIGEATRASDLFLPLQEASGKVVYKQKEYFAYKRNPM